jgi:glycosyltransferase involved in cell wall biosynthesis
MVSKKEKICVLEVANHFGTGGIERVMQDFALALDKNKFRVIIGVYRLEGSRIADFKKKGINVIKLSEACLLEVIKKEKIDIIHLHSFTGNFGRPQAGEAKILREVIFSGNYSKEADINLVISKSLLKKLHEKEKLIYGENYYILYNPQNVRYWRAYKIPHNKISKLRARLGVKEDQLLIGRLGRSEPSKSDFLFVKSIPLILKKLENVKFVFIGLPYLQRLLLYRHKSVRNKVIFLPNQPKDESAAKFYQIIDIFWHAASRGETFGNVNAEAMIFKKPVITHSTPFNNRNWKSTDNAQIEVVDHMRTGIIASYPKDIFEAVKFLQNNPKKAKEFGDSGYKKVLGRYNTPKVASSFQDIILKLHSRANTEVYPDKKEVEAFIEGGYENLLKQCLDEESYIGKKRYSLEKILYQTIEVAYLGLRLFLRRTINYDLEKRGYKKGYYSVLE